MKWNKISLIVMALLILFPLTLISSRSNAEGAAAFSVGLEYMAGIKYFEDGDYHDAANAFEEIVKRQADYQDTKLYLQYIEAQNALDEGDWAAAKAGFEVLIKENFLDSAQKLQIAEEQEAQFQSAQEEAASKEETTKDEIVADSSIASTELDTSDAPLQTVRATIVNATQVEIEWEAEDGLTVSIDLWYLGEKIHSGRYHKGKAVIAVAPEMEITVHISTGDDSREIELSMPAAKGYREYGYKRQEAYTAYVLDSKQDFYQQTRKRVKTITKDELLQNLEEGVVFGTHLSFTWNQTWEEKKLSSQVLVAKAPDGKLFAAEAAPMTIPGRLTGAYFVTQINKPLRYFLKDPDFSYGEYEFFIYNEGRLLGYSTLVVNPSIER